MKTLLDRFSLSGNMLKLLAIVLMTIDHIGAYILPQYRILRIIGRLAMPIFAFMIAEGCYYTKNRLRYLLTMAGFALVCQVVNFIFRDDLMQCILVTFFLSILLIYAVDYASKKQSFFSWCVMGAVFACVLVIGFYLPIKIKGFSIDYGVIGVFLPVMIYLGRNKSEKLILTAMGLAALALTSNVYQWFALFSVPLLALYNGTRGKHSMKYLFYIYYPLHLAVIYFIGQFLMK